MDRKEVGRLLFVAVKRANFDEMKRLLDLKGDVHHDHVRKEIRNRDVIYKGRILIVERAERSGLSIPTSTDTSKSLIALFLLVRLDAAELGLLGGTPRLRASVARLQSESQLPR